MRTIARIGFLLSLLCLPALAAVDATYYFTDYTSRPLSVRRVVVTPLGSGADYEGAQLSNRPLVYTPANYPTLTNGSGSIEITNLIAGYAYKVAFSDGYSEPAITNYFGTNISGAVNGNDYKTTATSWANGRLVQAWYAHLVTGSGTAATNVTLGVSGNATIVTNSPSAWKITVGYQTNIPVAAVTNAGTLAYSNSAAFLTLLTNGWEYADTVTSNALYAEITASAAGISEATATNIAAYQSLIVSNGLSARLLATNTALAAAIVAATNGLTSGTSGALTNNDTRAITFANYLSLNVANESFFAVNDSDGLIYTNAVDGAYFRVSPLGVMTGNGSSLTNIPLTGVTGLTNALDYLTNSIGGSSTQTNFHYAAVTNLTDRMASFALTNSVQGSNVTGTMNLANVNATNLYLNLTNAGALATDGDGLVVSGTAGLTEAQVVASTLTNTSLNASNLVGSMLTQFIQLQRGVTNDFNVLDYGADPTGTVPGFGTNIQAAIDAAVAAGGGRVRVPRGTYLIGSEIGKPGYLTENGEASFSIWGNNIYIVGDGRELTKIQWTDSAPHALHNPPNHNGIAADSVTNIGLFGLTLDGGHLLGKTNLGDMTQFYTNRFVRFEDIGIQNVKAGEGLDTDASFDIWVKNCWFNNVGGGAIGFGGPSGGADGGAYLIEGCYMNACGSRDPGLWEDSAVINAKSSVASMPTFISNTKIENSELVINSSSSTYISSCVFNTIGVGTTNIYVGGDRLTMDNCYINSTNVGGYFIYAPAGTLSLNNVRFSGKAALYAANPGGYSTITDCYFPDYNKTNHLIYLTVGGQWVISGNHFAQPGYWAIRITGTLTNSIISDNIFFQSGITTLAGAGISNNIISGNTLIESSLGLYGADKYNVISGNMTVGAGTVTIGSGSAYNRFENNRLSAITFNSAQPNDWIENIITGAVTGSLNPSKWVGNKSLTLAPYRNWTVTTNYTADAIDCDRVLLFNGSLLTNTIPSAATLNNAHRFTIKNIHATALEITNATGAQTFDGALRLSLPQYSTRTIISDGANWHIIGN